MTNEPMNPDDLPEPNAMSEEEIFTSDPTMEDTVVDEPVEEPIFGDTTQGDAPEEEFAFAPPAPANGSAVRTGLVRDPYATLGGVASGIAHRYMWDVVLVRIVFIVSLIVSFGFTTLLYLVAWLMIPRATMWPPEPVRGSRGGFNNRDIGIGLALLGVLAFVAVGGGTAGAFLLPLGLVGGGIWLLNQPERPTEVATAAMAAPMAGPTGPAIPSFTTPPAPVGQPVPPRKRRKRVIFAFALIPLLFIGFIVTAFVATAARTDWQNEAGVEGFRLELGGNDLGMQRYTPRTLDEIPNEIDFTASLIDVDLTDIPRSEWTALEDPIELNIYTEDGEVYLRIPEWLKAELEVSVRNGEIVETAVMPGPDSSTVQAGRSLGVGRSHSNPEIVIDVTVENGKVEVLTGS